MWLSEKGDFKNGKREAPWVFYDQDGTVSMVLTGTYRDGVKVK
jgi:antitoxin component YwqK of YwqJK toxin-antitoxin module